MDALMWLKAIRRGGWRDLRMVRRGRWGKGGCSSIWLEEVRGPEDVAMPPAQTRQPSISLASQPPSSCVTLDRSCSVFEPRFLHL